VDADGTLASGATTAMAFSSQSVMTLAHAAGALPIAAQAPIAAAQTERLIAQSMEASMFFSLCL